MARRLCLDQVAGRGTADLLIAGQQHGDRQLRRHVGAGKLPDRLQRHVVAALHVLDAGPPGTRALAPERQFRQRADGMHGIEVPHHQDARHVRRGVRKRGAHAIAEPHPPGNTFDARPGDHQFARRNVHHAVHRRSVVGRAFALDPNAQAVEYGIGIEGQFGSVHVADSLAQNAKILPTASGTTVASPNVRASWFNARQPVQ